jgi:hypothetical protein
LACYCIHLAQISRSKLFTGLILALGLTPSLFAQTATLRGQVADDSGALVPGAKVTLTGPNALVKTATSDDKGAYVFTGLATGDYQVISSAPDLTMLQPVTISLNPGIQTLNLQLKLVGTAEHVTVQEHAGPAVSTDTASNASAVVLRGDDLQALSDDPDDLAADLQALAGPAAGPSGGAMFVDGFSGGEIPPKESIREIRVNQNPFSPEYDKLGLGRIEIFTKPGADRYRGTIDYNFADDFWNTRNPYSAVKAPLLLNEFEGNAGGPLTKRSSFIVEWQRNSVDNGSIVNAVTLDPHTLAVNPFFSAYRVPQRFTRISPRIDYQLNDNNTLTLRYTFTHVDINGTGIGSFDLASRGYDYNYTNQTVQVTETSVHGSTINETRFQYFRSAQQRLAFDQAPEISVLGSFNDGGSLQGRSFDTQNYFELQNYTTTSKGAHVWKYGFRLRGQTDDNVAPFDFNGKFTFGGGLAPVLDANNQPVLDSSGQPLTADISSIERYRRTLLFQQLGYSPAQIRALGGGATQLTINAGMPGLSLHQIDLGAFVGDDWRIKPNFTLSAGLRYETQTNIHDWSDFGPRVAIAWAPAGSAKARPKTVIRAGFGTFYDRFALSNTLAAERYNGIVQQQYVISNPDFFPNIPSLAGLQATPQAVQEVSSHLRAPYTMQSSLSVERQLPAHTTLALTYTNSRGVHVFRSEDINAPLPGTYIRGVAGTGVFPYGQPGPIFLMESSGIYKQNQLIANVNTRVNAGFSIFGFYVLNKAMSNTDGISTFPANPYNFAGEYGPAFNDIRHRANIGGSINTRWNVRVSPFIVIQSGNPFDITAGSDLYDTTLFNGRPGFATDPNKPGVIQTQYGLLDPNPTPDEKLVPRNFGRGPGQISLNVRVAKLWGFGAERGGSVAKSGDAPVPSGPANPNLASGGGMGNLIRGPVTNHRYNLSVGMSARNSLNHTNPGPITGDITSPLFGRANQSAGNVNGEGFSENADNRRLEMQIRFTF